eukprot:1161425-Pelagomonas_calceolata.AAC.8
MEHFAGMCDPWTALKGQQQCGRGPPFKQHQDRSSVPGVLTKAPKHCLRKKKQVSNPTAGGSAAGNARLHFVLTMSKQHTTVYIVSHPQRSW